MTAPARRPLAFLIVGAWNTAFGYGAYVVCFAVLEPFGVNYVFALVPAQILAIGNAFLCHRFFVFGSAADTKRSFGRYLVVYGTAFAANLVLLPLLVEGAGFHPYLAQAVLVVVNVVGTYIAHNRYSFAEG